MPSSGEQPAVPIHVQAYASGEARVNQAGRDLHVHFADGVRRVAPGAPEGECPYPGLAFFDRSQARWFFGRDGLIHELVERLDARLQMGGGIQMVVAPSGAGKSSLLRAGLLSALDEGRVPGSSGWPQLVFTPTSEPLAALADRLGPLIGVDPVSVAQELAADPQWCVRELVGDHLDREGIRVVLVVDQFEELFTLCTDERQRGAFVELLAGLAGVWLGGGPVGLVVVGVRADFYAACADYLVLRAGLQDRPLVVGPMSEAELRDAIRLPARDVGLDIEDGLVELLMRDLGETAGGAAGYEAGRLPLLAHALRVMWRQRHGHLLTVDGYRVTGGIQRAVATTAEDIYGSLDSAGQHAAKTLFLQLIKFDEGSEDTRRRISRAELASGLNLNVASAVLDAFTQGRLLTQDQDAVEITHEALIRSWPRLKGWLSDDRSFLTWRDQLEGQRKTWTNAGKDSGALLRGAALAAATDWLRIRTDQIGGAARDYIMRSQRRQRRDTRRWQLITATLAILIVAVGTLTWVSQNRGNRLAQQLAAANAQSLAVASDARAADDPAFAAKLALAAWQSDPSSVPARVALGRQYMIMRSVDHVYSDITSQPIENIFAGPDDDTVLLGTREGITAIHGLRGLRGPEPVTWKVPRPGHNGFLVSGDGRWLLTGDDQGNYLLWDVLSRAGPYHLQTHLGDSFVAFSPSGDRLVIEVPTDAGPQLTTWALPQRTSTTTQLHVPRNQPAPGVQPLVEFNLTDDPANIVLKTPQSGGASSARLSIVRITDGAVLHIFPPNSQVIHGGKAILTCTPGTTAPESRAQVTVVALDTQAVLSRLPLSADSGDGPCGLSTRYKVTSDGNHLIDLGYSPGGNDRAKASFARLISLSSGAVYDFSLPQGNYFNLGSIERRPDAAGLTTAGWANAVDGATEAPDLLIARGASLLRISNAIRDWSDTLGMTTDLAQFDSSGKYIIVMDGDRVVVLDPSTGRRLGELNKDQFPDPDKDSISLPFLVGGEFVHLARVGGTWRLTECSFPTLACAAPLVLPGPPDPMPSDVPGAAQESDQSPKYSLIGGVLSAVDGRSHQMFGPPLTLGDTPAERREYRKSSFVVRPGHPDQVAVEVGTNRISLWSMSQRRKIGTIQTAYSEISRSVFDKSGNQLAVLTRDHTLELWDVNAQRQVHLPVPVPRTSSMKGFTTDGYLLGVDQEDTLQLIDVSSGAIIAELSVPQAIFSEPNDAAVDSISIGNNSQMPFQLPLTMKVWAAHLCAVTQGNFSVQEKANLPPGADPSVLRC